MDIRNIITSVPIITPAKAGQLTQAFYRDAPSTPRKFMAPIDLLVGDSIRISNVTGILYEVKRAGEVIYTGKRFYVDTDLRSKHRIVDSSTGFRFSVYDTPDPEHPDEDLAELLAELLNKIPLP